MGKKTVSVTLSEDVAKQLDECASYMNLNRSAFVEWLLKTTLPSIPEVTSRIKETFKKRAKEFWEWL